MLWTVLVLPVQTSMLAIMPYQNELVMHILHYLDEIRPANEIPELKNMQKVSLVFKTIQVCVV